MPKTEVTTRARWPAEAIERRKVSDLIPYARNARTHSDAQVAQIAASIKEWGWTNPVLIDADGMIIAGHGRVLAARKLNIDQIPCMVATGWSEAAKRAYILADNQLALNAGWDTQLLKVELKEIGEAGFDVTLVGFGDDFLAGLLNEGTEGLTDPDDVPEPPAEPVTVLGDVYVLGKHRLVCGDSTNADDVAKALNGVAPHLMVTDPPYGVVYDAQWRSAPGSAGPHAEGTKRNKSAAYGKVENDDKADWREAWALFPGDVAYVWHAGNMAHIVAESLLSTGLEIRAQIIWAKNQLVIGRGDYHPQHEPCWYAVRKGRKGHYCGDRKQTTIWNIDKPRKSETGHSTQKPVECMKRPIVNNSSPGQAIYDPFLGSGTTLIACEMEGRACHGLELSPAYCDVIVKRWEDFTGLKAQRITAEEAEHAPA
jgi:DNA modification methylase